MTRIIPILLLALASAELAHAAPVGEQVEYEARGIRLVGYLARDEAIGGPRPGILVIHEWWGLNDFARARADRLAELGYVALAVDMFGGGKQAAHPDQAAALAGQLGDHPDEGRARFEEALELLKQQPDADPNRIAAIGYCFGGGVALDMARQGAPLAGVVSFHGLLDSRISAAPGEVGAKVLVLHGGADRFVPQETLEAFEQEMRSAGADLRLVIYPEAGHGFTNPDATRLGDRFDLPLAYNMQADRDAWERMQGFLGEIFDE